MSNLFIPKGVVMGTIVALGRTRHVVDELLDDAEAALAQFSDPDVAASVRALPALERAVICSCFGIGCEQLPLREVAVQLRMSRSATRRLKRRALMTLRHRLVLKEAA